MNICMPDKKYKLNFHNDTLKNNTMTFPVVPSKIDDFASDVKDYLAKIEPGQMRFYCKEQKNPLRLHALKEQGFTQSQMNKNLPLGEHSIRTLMRQAAQKIGYSDWENFQAHAMRRHCITKMVSDMT